MKGDDDCVAKWHVHQGLKLVASVRSINTSPWRLLSDPLVVDTLGTQSIRATIKFKVGPRLPTCSPWILAALCIPVITASHPNFAVESH